MTIMTGVRSECKAIQLKGTQGELLHGSYIVPACKLVYYKVRKF